MLTLTPRPTRKGRRMRIDWLCPMCHCYNHWKWKAEDWTPGAITLRCEHCKREIEVLLLLREPGGEGEG